MERLVERGVNYIETARGDTVSESFLGEALEGGLREKFVLATKSMARTRAEMERAIEISLRKMCIRDSNNYLREWTKSAILIV